MPPLNWGEVRSQVDVLRNRTDSHQEWLKSHEEDLEALKEFKSQQKGMWVVLGIVWPIILIIIGEIIRRSGKF